MQRQRSRAPRVLVLVLLIVGLLAQPTALLARAQETAPPPPVVTVVGVAGATLRSGPDGASLAVRIVTPGEPLTIVGPAQVTAGVVWWPVRTADGATGYLPAGLLAGAPPSPPITANTLGAPEGSVVAPGVATTGPANADSGAPTPTVTPGQYVTAGAEAQPSRWQPGAALTPTVAPTPASASPTALPAPSAKPPRTTVERRRGRDVRVAQLDEETAPNGRRMGAGRIVVRFQPGANQTARIQAHQAAGAGAAARAGLPDMTVVEVQPGTVAQALAAYRARGDVAWAEPDYVRRVTHQPNDPRFPTQPALEKIGAPLAWDVTTGSPDIKIAVLDCGIFSESSPFAPPDGNKGHEDLRGKIVLEKNFSNAVTDVDDWCNHGTLMAGIAGAATNTTPPTGVASVGYRTMLLNGKVLNDQGSGLDSWVAEGIVWAADNGADVISMSLGSANPCSQTLQTAVNYAWEKGAVLVAAAGNGGEDGQGDPVSDAPASCDNVISVGAINQDDTRASFSNYGPSGRPRVQLAAPGVNVLSTNYVGTYSTVSGTSPSTPHVAAAAALVKAKHGGSNQSIVDRLLSMADPIAGTGSLWAHGRLNIAAAVGPASCNPRPAIAVSPSANGSKLDVTVAVQGLGNALRYIRVGGESGALTNASLSFPGTVTAAQDGQLYVPTTVGSTFTFQVTRTMSGAPTTVPFTVFDGCGGWNSFVGGGAAAGF